VRSAVISNLLSVANYPANYANVGIRRLPRKRLTGNPLITTDPASALREKQHLAPALTELTGQP
jgi:hypothetical protein